MKNPAITTLDSERAVAQRGAPQSVQIALQTGWLVTAVAGVLVAPAAVLAQEPGAAGTAAAEAGKGSSTLESAMLILQNRETFPSGLQLKASFEARLNRPRTTKPYIEALYKDRLLRRKGQQVSFLDPTHQFPVPESELPDELKGKTADPDTNRFSLDLTEGRGSGTGPLFDALGVDSFLAPRLKVGRYRTVSRLSGRLDGRSVSYRLGLESPPYHLVDRRKYSNWVVVGLNGQGYWQKGDEAKDAASGLVTYRSFLGKAGGYKSNMARAPFKVQDFLIAYPNVKSLEDAAESLKATKVTELTPQQVFIVTQAARIETTRLVLRWASPEGYRAGVKDFFVQNAGQEGMPAVTVDQFLRKYPLLEDLTRDFQFKKPVPAGLSGMALVGQFLRNRVEAETGGLSRDVIVDLSDQAKYKEIIELHATRFLETLTKEPSNALWLEASGWYTLGENPGGPRFKPLTSLRYTLWRDWSQETRSQFQLGYENGYNPAEPTERVNRVLLTAGVNF